MDIVLVAQISIFTETMGTRGWLGDVWAKKKKNHFTILIRVTKTLNDLLPN